MGKTITENTIEVWPEDVEGIARYISQKERDAMPDSDFGWPEEQKYPIPDQVHLDAAVKLIGRAPEGKQDAIKKRIKAIAKRKGLQLPDTWKDEDEKGDSGRAQSPMIIRADGNHEAFSGTHTHAHPAFGSQGDDATHEHKHNHDNDANHNHSHSHLDGNWQAKGEENGSAQKAAAPDIVRSLPSETTIYAPILRIDRAKREVVVRATAEDLDSYGTVISFDGSKEAFANWRGNIREMHDPSKAVGRAIQWTPVDDEKAIDLTLRVSKGAQDTWEKVLDGTLSGASIGARKGKWGKKQWQGKEVPYLERYDLVEVSLVDNPSCPGCDVKIVRSDGMATDILDFTEDVPQQPETTRKGARVSADTRTALHSARDHALQGAKSAMESCNCAECQGGLNCLDPDKDGDIDILASLDTDNDAAGGNGDGSGIMNAIKAEITRHLAPTIQRMNGIAARLATTDTTTPQLVPDPEITRRFETLEQRLSGLDEVRSLLSEVKGLAEKSTQLAELIAAQPQSGGPVVNSAVLRNMTPAMQPDPLETDTETVARLAKAGILNKTQQVEAVLYLQRRQHEQGMPGRR